MLLPAAGQRGVKGQGAGPGPHRGELLVRLFVLLAHGPLQRGRDLGQLALGVGGERGVGLQRVHHRPIGGLEDRGVHGVDLVRRTVGP